MSVSEELSKREHRELGFHLDDDPRNRLPRERIDALAQKSSIIFPVGVPFFAGIDGVASDRDIVFPGSVLERLALNPCAKRRGVLAGEVRETAQATRPRNQSRSVVHRRDYGANNGAKPTVSRTFEYWSPTSMRSITVRTRCPPSSVINGRIVAMNVVPENDVDPWLLNVTSRV